MIVTKDWNSLIPAYDQSAAERCQQRWNAIAKPLGSLGLLEKAVIQIAGLTGNPDYALTKRAVVVMCADNGVVAQGITQTGSAVTALVACNMTTQKASVCRMAKVAHADVIPVDIGMLEPQHIPQLLDRRVRAGTRDMSCQSAMTREEAVLAIEHGIELVSDLKAQGYRILMTGEMGIGNTTTSSAMASVLLGCDPAVVTGKGAGLSNEALERKIRVIQQAIDVNKPHPQDALDVLAKVGGLDIAGLTGIFIGGAIHKIPVLVDGLISAVSALTAQMLCPNTRHAMLASHVSAEPAGRLLLQALKLSPLITAGMYLGEGSGAVAALPLLDMGYAVYSEMPTFEETAIDTYVPLD